MNPTAVSFSNVTISFRDVGKILGAFFALILIRPLLSVGRMLYNRIKLKNLMAGKNYPWYDPLGAIRDFFSCELFKNGHSMNSVFLHIIHERVKLFGKHKIFCDWLSYIPIVFFVKAEAAEVLLKQENKKEKPWFFKFYEPLFGTGLLTSSGDKWKSRRKLMNPCFHSDVLKDFLPVFNENAQLLVKSLEKQNEGDFIRIGSPVGICVLDILMKTIFGVKQGIQHSNGTQYLQSVKRVQKIGFERAANVFYWWDFLFRFTKRGRELKLHLKHTRAFVTAIIQDKKKEFLSMVPSKTSNGRRRALMDFLIEHHLTTKELNDEDIREEVNTFVAAGLGTTTATICWSLYIIGLYKAVQQKLHEELNAVFGNDVDSPVNVEDLKNLKYLDLVLKESKRLYPPVPSLHKVAHEDLNISGSTVPKGTVCIAMMYFIHRDEEYYPNPEHFDPDRFLPENSANRHPYAYLPFSIGPRSCIGAKFSEIEEKVIISTILRHFTVESEDQRDKVPKLEITLRPSVPIRIKLVPRC